MSTNTTTTANMSLILPIPGLQTGLQYAIQNNSAFSVIDSHTHIPGQGLPIPTAAININNDLNFNAYNGISFRSTRFNSQVSPLALVTDINCISVVGPDLYYNDGNGNKIQMTIGGSVNTSGSGNISGMGSTTATVAYTVGNATFTFNSNTATPANMKFGPIQIGLNSASPSFVTITPSNSQASNFTLTLPSALPAAQALLSVDNTGTMQNVAPDNSTITITSNLLNVPNGGITKPKLAVLGQQISSSCGAFTTSATGPSSITNLSVTITTTGRPVYLMLIPDGTSNSASIYFAPASSVIPKILISRDGGSTYFYTSSLLAGPSTNNILLPPGCISTVDITSANTYTYTVYAAIASGSGTWNISYCKLIAFEL